MNLMKMREIILNHKKIKLADKRLIVPTPSPFFAHTTESAQTNNKTVNF